MSSEHPSLRDDFNPEVVLGLDPDGLMATFNRAGLLAAADIHVASALGRLGGDKDEQVALAVALAVRAPRVGHVLTNLLTVRETAIAGVEEQTDLSGLPWPQPEPWLECLRCSPLVSVGEDGPRDRPIRLIGSSLYLDRYWRDETDVAFDLIARSDALPLDVDEDVLAQGTARLYGDDRSGLQQRARCYSIAAASERHRWWPRHRQDDYRRPAARPGRGPSRGSHEPAPSDRSGCTHRQGGSANGRGSPR